jgi:hypothetical protein
VRRVTVTFKDKKSLPANQWVTLCNVCHETCHLPMDSGGNCTVCKNKCHWSDHSNQSYYWVEGTREEEQTVEDILRQYNVEVNDKAAKWTAMLTMIHRLQEVHRKVLGCISQIHTCVTELRKIAMKSNPLTLASYIDLLIKVETDNGKPGWQERVRYLEEAQASARIIESVEKNEQTEFQKKLSALESDVRKRQAQVGPGNEQASVKNTKSWADIMRTFCSR